MFWPDALGPRSPSECLWANPPSLFRWLPPVPPHVLNQSDVASAATRGFAGRYDDFDRMARVFKSSGIRQRHAVRPIDWYLKPLGWPERTSAYLEGACQLFVDAATRALEAAELNAAEVDTIVTISSTGVATPDLRGTGRRARRVSAPMSSRFPSSALAAPAVSPGSRLLPVSRRASGQHCVASRGRNLHARVPARRIVQGKHCATALFGDGAAACVIRAYDGGRAVEMSGQHTAPDTARHHGLEESIRKASASSSTARSRRSAQSAHRTRDRGHYSPRSGLASRRRRSLRLSPWRLEGHRRPRADAVDTSRVLSTTNARSSRTMATCRRRPCYSCSDHIVRARHAFAHIVDRDGPWLHLPELCFPEERPRDGRRSSSWIGHRRNGLRNSISPAAIRRRCLQRKPSSSLRPLSGDRADACPLVGQSMDFRRDAPPVVQPGS